VIGTLLFAALSMAAQAHPRLVEWHLDNGLKVLFLPDHKAPVVTVQVFYHVGGKDEPADKRGIAHLFEHLMFKGSEHVPPEGHARFIDSVGGVENAFTTDDLTGYYDAVPPSALEFTLKLEAERMRRLTLIQKTIDSEREVVKEELRTRLENNPVTRTVQKVLRLAYTVHPYRTMPFGEAAMLDRVTVEDCHKFYDAFYRPNNATLVVAGDTDEGQVRRFVAAHFAPLPRGPTPARARVVEPPQRTPRRAVLPLPVQLPAVVGAYHIPAASSDDIYALEVLQQILSEGESSRLWRRLVRRDRLAVSAGGATFEHEEPGLFIIWAFFLPTTDAASVRRALDEEMARIAALPVGAAELAKARNQLAARAVFRSERVSDLASRIGVDDVEAHDARASLTEAARYDAVTARDIRRVARTHLISANLSEVTLVPAAAAP
jgi:zinc protease